MTTRILFVCHGNICRSTMAQYVMQHLVQEAGREDDFVIDSAATSREQIGDLTHYGTREKLESEGIFVGDHRARQLMASDADDWDLIIGMDEANMRNIERMLGVGRDSGKVAKLLEYVGSERDVADPWYTGDFDATFDDVMAGCTAMLEQL